MPAHRKVFPPLQPVRPCQHPFHTVPETDSVEQRIQHIAHRAVMAVFRVRMMTGMVPGRLQQVGVLQKRNQPSIFLARPMCPFMKLVGVGAQNRKQPHFPGQQAPKPRGHKDSGQNRQVPRRLPPVMPRHEARIMMMHDVWPRHDTPDQRRVLPHVGISSQCTNPPTKSAASTVATSFARMRRAVFIGFRRYNGWSLFGRDSYLGQFKFSLRS